MDEDDDDDDDDDEEEVLSGSMAGLVFLATAEESWARRRNKTRSPSFSSQYAGCHTVIQQ